MKSRQALTVSESNGSIFGSESDDTETSINFDIQLPENVVNMVQMVIARAESIDCSQAGVSKYARKAFCITNATAPDNPIVHASPGFMELTGYDMHSILGHNCRFLQGPETDRNEVSRGCSFLIKKMTVSVYLSFFSVLVINLLINNSNSLPYRLT